MPSVSLDPTLPSRTRPRPVSRSRSSSRSNPLCPSKQHRHGKMSEKEGSRNEVGAGVAFVTGKRRWNGIDEKSGQHSAGRSAVVFQSCAIGGTTLGEPENNAQAKLTHSYYKHRSTIQPGHPPGTYPNKTKSKRSNYQSSIHQPLRGFSALIKAASSRSIF